MGGFDGCGTGGNSSGSFHYIRMIFRAPQNNIRHQFHLGFHIVVVHVDGNINEGGAGRLGIIEGRTGKLHGGTCVIADDGSFGSVEYTAHGVGPGKSDGTHDLADNAFFELVNGKIQDIPGVAGTETLISLEESFSREIPVEQKAIIANEDKE